jgi:hypothetical protein
VLYGNLPRRIFATIPKYISPGSGTAIAPLTRNILAIADIAVITQHVEPVATGNRTIRTIAGQFRQINATKARYRSISRFAITGSAAGIISIVRQPR